MSVCYAVNVCASPLCKVVLCAHRHGLHYVKATLDSRSNHRDTNMLTQDALFAHDNTYVGNTRLQGSVHDLKLGAICVAY